jgi:hypothetical protein
MNEVSAKRNLCHEIKQLVVQKGLEEGTPTTQDRWKSYHQHSDNEKRFLEAAVKRMPNLRPFMTSLQGTQNKS